MFEDGNLGNLRKRKSNEFAKIFKKYLSDLDVMALKEDRYLDIYRINSFPYQGVELHSTMLAYHFCFNKIISETKNIHRMPFLLDGILKEDIDPNSLEKIFRFIGKNLPIDTQSFISISDYTSSKDEVDGKIAVKRFTVEEVKSNYFDNDSEIIYISNDRIKRAFLSQTLDNNLYIYQNTMDILSA